MRETRLSGSEGGGAIQLSLPYLRLHRHFSAGCENQSGGQRPQNAESFPMEMCDFSCGLLYPRPKMLTNVAPRSKSSYPVSWLPLC